MPLITTSNKFQITIKYSPFFLHYSGGLQITHVLDLVFGENVFEQIIHSLSFQQLEEEKKRADQERQKLQKVEQEKERARTREEYIRSMGRTGRAGVVNANYVNMIAEQKLKISQRDLRHQEKILRDHCLVMGHVNDKFLA